MMSTSAVPLHDQTPADDLLESLVALVSADPAEAEILAAANPVADTIGVMLAGGDDPRTRELMRTAHLSVSGVPGLACLPGGRLWGSAADVALMLGFAAHLLDHDDDETEIAMAHLSAPCLAAALAIAGRQGAVCTPDDLIAAYITGCKAMLVVGSAVNPALYKAGWHATSVLGVFGATAAAARLLKLDDSAKAHALGLAASAASGPRGAFGGEGKPFQVGLAAASGVRAAFLAKARWKSGPGALAGSRGLLTRMADLRMPQEAGAFPPPGFVTKLYPTCTATHAAVSELIALRTAARQGKGLPASIRCSVDPFVPQILIAGLPDGPEAARFSLAYCLAYAALHGALTPAAFVEAAFRDGMPADQRIRSLMARIEIAVDDTLPKGPSGISTGATVTLVWEDGTTMQGTRETAPGSAASPLSSEVLCEKFIQGLAATCPPQDASALWGRLTNLANFPTVTALLEALPETFTLPGQTT